MDALKLTFPSIQSGQKFIVETEPKAVEAWLNRLAFVETDKIIFELTRVISSLNRCPQKLNALEKNLYFLSGGYLILSRHMREQHDRHKTLVNKDQYKALHSLSTEIAFGFKRLVAEVSEQKLLLRRSFRLANAINHAQHYLGIMLIEQYQLYSPIPAYIWRELHLLYEYAEKHKLTNKPLCKEEPNPLEPCATINESFIRNCLMSVINPYHIEDNQHWHLYKYLSHWSKLVDITADLNKYSQERCFIIDLSEANKPHIATEESDYENESQIRLLKTHALLNNIEEQIIHYEDTNEIPMPSFYEGIEPSNAIKLLNRIHDFCDKFLDRISTRYPLLTDVDTVWGLSSIKKILIHENNNNQPLELSQELSKFLSSQYKTHLRWQAVNHSEGGVCLKNHFQQVDDLRIGNLVISKRHVNNKPQKSWQLGIVRWLQGEKKHGATVGLEYIHGSLDFIEYLTQDKNNRTISHTVLLVRPFDQTSPFLITAKNLIGSAKSIQVSVNDEVRDISLTHLIETNSKISIFGLRF